MSTSTLAFSTGGTMQISKNRLTITVPDDDLPDLQKFLLRALNTWEPKDVPKWAWELDAAVMARLNDIKIAGEKK